MGNRLRGTDATTPGKDDGYPPYLGGETTRDSPGCSCSYEIIPERERFSVPHAARDPQVLQDRNLDNEDIFQLIKNPPAMYRKPWKRTRKKTPPHLARKIWRKYIDLAQKQGYWASITFRVQYMPQMVPMTKASWERASFNSTEKEAAAANWAGERKATLLTGLN